MSRPPFVSILRWGQRLLFAGAAAALACCAVVLADAWLFQWRAHHELERQLAARPAQPGGAADKAVIRADGLIGRIDIRRIGISAAVFESTDKLTLRRAVGHVSNTALPGQRGNVGLAAHRDSFFRPLKDIRQNDIISVTTLGGEYHYRVVSLRIVKPSDMWVLNPTVTQALTLVTCYPFFFVGAAPDRFVVHAERIIQDDALSL